MRQDEFIKLQNQIMDVVTTEVSDKFHKRSAGIPLKDCLVESKLAMAVYLLDDVEAMSFNTAPKAALNIPATVKCSDLTITFNKLKSYVFKRR